MQAKREGVCSTLVIQSGSFLHNKYNITDCSKIDMQGISKVKTGQEGFSE